MYTDTQIRISDGESGFSLIELMISMVVLLIGLGGLLVLLVTAMYTNKTASTDTASTMVAEHVLEQISAQGLQATTPLTITDCTNTTTTFATNPALIGAGNSGATGGNGATLTAGGIIDWTQAFASVPTDPVSGFPYAIRYTDCGANGRQTVYDVRWNMITMSNNDRLTVIGARPSSANVNGGLRFVIPANLRTVN